MATFFGVEVTVDESLHLESQEAPTKDFKEKNKRAEFGGGGTTSKIKTAGIQKIGIKTKKNHRQKK